MLHAIRRSSQVLRAAHARSLHLGALRTARSSPFAAVRSEGVLARRPDELIKSLTQARWNSTAISPSAEESAEAELKDGEPAAVYDAPTSNASEQRSPAAEPTAAEEVSASPAETGQVTHFQQLADLKLVHPRVIRTITDELGYEKMTDVQAMTIRETLSGEDVIAQAKTGTGKTIAFLVPMIQRLLQENFTTPAVHRNSRDRDGRYNSPRGSVDIRGLIISPTRELAEQIAVDAKKLVRGTPLMVQTAVGGSGKAWAMRNMRNQGCHILIATPGRLTDILEDPEANISAPKLKMLVLDEADRLLDQGFSEAIDRIMQLLPDREVVDRQTLLYSATIPKEVRKLVGMTLKPEFLYINTISDDDVPTHQNVKQNIVKVRGFENLMPALLELTKRELALANDPANGRKPFKAIVFFNTTMMTSFGARTFEGLGETASSRDHPLAGVRLLEIHSRLTQQERSRASNDFRRAKSAILFSSDVSARGMDFPDVTHVIQINRPQDVDQYVHRLGRTARGNSKDGNGYLFLTDLETKDRAALTPYAAFPLTRDDSLRTASIDMSVANELPASTAETLIQIQKSTKNIDARTLTATWTSLLGMGTRSKGSFAVSLVDFVRNGWGWSGPPRVSSTTLKRLGFDKTILMDYAGEDAPRFRDRDDGGERRFGRGRDGDSRSGGRRGGAWGGDSNFERSYERKGSDAGRALDNLFS